MSGVSNKIRQSREDRIKAHSDLYASVFGKKLNIDSPVDFNEKIHWLILNYYGKNEGDLADKECVKNYVSRMNIDGLKIPKTLKTYKSVDDIDLRELPEKFVLKCNHFSGDVFICKDKKNFDLDFAKKRLNEILKKDFADVNLEYHYSYIEPLIMAEEYLDDNEHKNPLDYKIYCFNGKAESILVCSNREEKLKLNDFDLNWNELDYTTDEYRSKIKIARPKKLKKMIRIAETLAKGIPFVRVDLYEIGDEIYFGEYTFTPGAGIIKYYKQGALDYFGAKIDIEWYIGVKRKCDIVIPIFNAYGYLENCINSVLKCTNFVDNRLILIDDNSPDKRVFPLLKKYERKNKDKIVVIKNERNLGFVKSVNEGMKYSRNNVLLLNSDTVVSDGWLERIIKCSEQDERIATVTPFSNNLTPMSPLPEEFRKKGFPDGYSFEQMAELVKNCSMKVHPELPTSHGFCMFIKREALDVVGYFDEEVFGKGYGEENDFCFRCLERGYRHILCDDVYVFHAGTQSFLSKRKFHNDELIKKHPAMMKKVGEWYEKQGIRKITDNIVLAIGAKEKRINVLLLMRGKKDESVLLVINELRQQYNIHILNLEGGYYTLHSFFRDVDLMTAIYRKPVTFTRNGGIAKEYEEMIDDIKSVFGVSIIIESFDVFNKEYVVDRCGETGKEILINFSKAQKKMLEYDFARDILQGEDTIKTEEKVEQKKKRTIPERIYLKVRYILLGR